VGEYRISPLPLETFDNWAKSHPEFPHPLQYSQQELVISIILPPHDRTAGVIVRHILKAVDKMCPQDDARVEFGTGRIYYTSSIWLAVTPLKNGVRKNGDGHIYTHQNGQATFFPGIVVEVGFGDSRRKSRRDIRLWLENSDCKVYLVKRFADE